MQIEVMNCLGLGDALLVEPILHATQDCTFMMMGVGHELFNHHPLNRHNGRNDKTWKPKYRPKYTEAIQRPGFTLFDSLALDFALTTGILPDIKDDRPNIYLAEQEKVNHHGDYVLINAGHRFDMPAKHYPQWQEVVNKLPMSCIQVGMSQDIHRPLEGVVNMVGKTGSLRRLLTLAYNARLILSPDSFLSHVAYAMNKPCITMYSTELAPLHWFAHDGIEYMPVTSPPQAIIDRIWRMQG